jgi:hypothetical protein
MLGFRVRIGGRGQHCDAFRRKKSVLLHSATALHYNSASLNFCNSVATRLCPGCAVACHYFIRAVVVSWLHYLSFKHGVLASPWWQRVLLVLPVCALLWLGVAWALGGQA